MKTSTRGVGLVIRVVRTVSYQTFEMFTPHLSHSGSDRGWRIKLDPAPALVRV